MSQNNDGQKESGPVEESEFPTLREAANMSCGIKG